jgi:methyl-accepting chemotaxis protein
LPQSLVQKTFQALKQHDIYLDTTTFILILDTSTDQKLDRVAANLEAVTAQIGLLSEQQTATAIQIDKLVESIDKLGDRLDRQIDRIAAIAEQQAVTVANLTQLVSALVGKLAA